MNTQGCQEMEEIESRKKLMCLAWLCLAVCRLKPPSYADPPFFLLEDNCFTMSLVSAVQQLESAISVTYISSLSLDHTSPPPGHHKALAQGHTAASHQLFYTWQFIYGNATLSIHPTFPFSPAVSTSPSASLSRASLNCKHECPGWLFLTCQLKWSSLGP